MASGFLTSGVQLRIETAPGPPIQYTTIEGVRSIRGPGRTREIVDVTSLESTARENISGLASEGTFTVDLYLRRGTSGQYVAGQQALENAFNSGNRLSFQYRVPMGAQNRTYTFQGQVTAFEFGSEAGEAQQASATVTITGPITITVA